MIVTDLHTMLPTALPQCPMAVAVGNFDGLHIGHQALLAACRAVREQNPGVVCAVWTFSTHSRADRIRLITPHDDRLALFAQYGMDYVISVDFSAVRDLTPEQYVSSVLHDTLHCHTVVCGFNFHFGAGGAGSASDLERLCADCRIRCRITDDVVFGGETVSSTRIRQLLQNGDAETAAKLMGRPFSFAGEVLHGRRLGRTLDFPTVNQTLPEELLSPAYGVYLTECVSDSFRCYGVTDFGVRPTVNGSGERCETHLLRRCDDLYGQRLRISFLEFIRPEQKFQSKEQLRRSIRHDVEECRRRIGESGH